MFAYLQKVLDVSDKKFSIDRGNRDATRLKWGRLIVQSVQTYGSLLETTELDELAKDIEAIKIHVGMVKT